MTSRRISSIALLGFLVLTMIYPLGHVVLKAFIVQGTPSLKFFLIMGASEYYRDTLCTSLNLAITVTMLSTALAYPLAMVMSRYSLPAQGVLHALLLLPLISPPFVGALGFRQLFGRFGSVNTLLGDLGIIEHPVQWLGGGGILGIVILQVLHLVPILYLSISASLKTAHVTLEEAGRVCGASRWQVMRRIVLPLSLPGWFAGASLVFIASFTDLGTPLIFDYRGLIPVQIYNMLSDLNENPVGYSLVVLTCMLSIGLFLLSRSALSEGGYASSARTRQGRLSQNVTPGVRSLLTLLVFAYALVACVPQISVVLVASAKTWFASVLPTEFTLSAFATSLSHPMTAHSLVTSLWLSVLASLITMIIGFQAAYIITRTRGVWSRSFEVLSIIPLAVPGIIFAFGYIGAFSGTILDNRINPFPLLLAAYSVRRMPAMVRSGTAGLQEASVALEEAALVLGAGPLLIARRIVLPLVSRHIIVGAILTFAYSMIEVSDSILLAMEVRFYPVSKAIYTLMGRPDGVELASALGTVVMVIMLIAFYGAEWFATRGERRRTFAKAAVLLALLFPISVSAQTDEIVAVSPHWEGIKEEFERGFSSSYKQETGRDVTIRWLDIGGTSDIVKYLKNQHKAHPGELGIDLIFGGGTDTMIELSRAGVLTPATISKTVTDSIPPSVAGIPLSAPQGEWRIAAISMFGIIANRIAAERMGLSYPRSWGDLGKAEYFDLVGIADPSKSGSMHAMMEVILQGFGWTDGWKLIGRIAGNARTISNHASQVGKDVATGEMIFGIAIDTYAGDVIRQVGRQRIEFIVPEDHPTITGDGIALISGAPHPDVASRFIEFVLSEAGQKLWYYKQGTPGGPTRFEIGKLPILPHLYETGQPATVVPGNPFTLKNVSPFDAPLAARRWNIVNDLFQAFILEPHDRLVAFTRTHRGAQPPTVPITDAELNILSPEGAWGSDTVLRSQKLREWGSQASQQLPMEHGALYSYRWLPPLAVLSLLSFSIIRRLLRRTRLSLRTRRPC